MFTIKKRYFLIALLVAAGVVFVLLSIKYNANRDVQFRTAGTAFQIYKDGKWQDFLIKGVNIGAAKPGFFPGEMGISKNDYERWFRQIAEMNANAIRVYTILSPDFYQALFEYNIWAKKPLYIFHGVWIDEDAVNNLQDAYSPEITDAFKSEMSDLIDVLHGKKIIAPRQGHASGAYVWDVSCYVAGYILGIELDAGFVTSTNEKNATVKNFNGDFLYTKDASPYECWQAEMGDYAIRYEQRKYKTQKPVSWTNWITTDPLRHLSDPDRAQEDAVSVDINHILKKDNFVPGIFASYHVYPYYPEFMSFDPVYTKYIDQKGKPNPYMAYLLDLRKYISVPLLVAEFGIPTSRGRTHENVLTGYNQGFVSEEEAGEYVSDMFDSIVASGCCGGLIFSWQDEWSKRGWNTMDYDLPDRRAYWSNAQSSEQHYGILSFDPGSGKSVCYVDGDTSEWKWITPLAHKNGLSLSVLSDERYMYFLIQDPGGNTENAKYAIGVSGLKNQGNLSFKQEGLTFKNPCGECVIIDGKDNSAVYVDAYYDVFYRQYSRLSNLGIILDRNEAFEVKNSGIFNPINLIMRRALKFPLTGLVLPPSYYETGKLLYGNANPKAEDYSSLADFCMNPADTSIEIRIPWQLFNVADPSTKTIIGDIYSNDDFNINPVTIDGFTFELYKIGNNGITEGGSGFYSWKPWEEVQYHERLKQSYEIIKRDFAEY